MIQAQPHTSAFRAPDSLEPKLFRQRNKRKILVAQWIRVDEQLICQWIIE